MSEIFERKNAASKEAKADEQHIARLERKLGQVIVERDWLAEKSKELGID